MKRIAQGLLPAALAAGMLAAPARAQGLGDADLDTMVDATDASLMLAEYASRSTSQGTTFTNQQGAANADVDGNGVVDAVDASTTLRYYAYFATGGNKGIEEWLVSDVPGATAEGGNPDAAQTQPKITVTVDGTAGGKVFEPADARGKKVACTIEVSGADKKYATTGFHVRYDARLALATNNLGAIDVRTGGALEYSNAATPLEDPTAPAGRKGFFVASAGNGNVGLDGTMWTFSFTVPADAAAGDVYPIDIVSRSTGDARDLFVDSMVTDDGRNMQAYAFSKGIFCDGNPNAFASGADAAVCAALAGIAGDADGYIAIAGGGTVVDDEEDTVVASASSEPFRLDTREGPFESDGSETLTFSTLWHPAGDATVTILQSGAVAATVATGLLDEGTRAWRVDRDGTYVLKHATMQGGRSIANETATFIVKGLTPALVPTLKWKYAKNVNGWYCAQVAFPWRKGYDTVLSDMRLLFADRFNAKNQRTAYLVDPSTTLDPLPRTETYKGTTYRAAPIDLSGFAKYADGTRAVAGVSDSTMASSLDRVPRSECTICLRVANRDLSTVEPVANKLAFLAWKMNGTDVFLPIAEIPARTAGRYEAPAPRPLTLAEANISDAFGLAPAAVSGGTVTCRIASIAFGADGSVKGTFAISAEDAGRVLAESGELASGATLSVLGAEGLGGPFRALDASSCGVKLLSRKPPFAFSVAKPGKNVFFKVRLQCADQYE